MKTARINAATEITVIHSITAEALEQINIIASRPVGAPLGESLDESACTVHPGEPHVYSYGVLMENEHGQFVYGIVYDPNYEGEEVIFAPLDASLFTEGYAQGWYLLDYDTFTIIPCSGHKEHDLISAKEQAIAELVAGAEALNNVPAALAVLEYYTNTINQVTFIPQIEMLKTAHY